MDAPMISIVMPTYNANSFIRDAMDSILKQTLSEYELLIVDDCSTDDTCAIIDSYHDDRIKLLHNSHDFIQSLNMGMNHAQGKYIARMDADDIMHPQRLQIQYEFMESNTQISVCGSWFEAFGEINRTFQPPIKHNDIAAQLLIANVVCHPAAMIRRSAISDRSQSVYKPEYIYAEDYRLWIELIMQNHHFANIPHVLLKHRIYKQQTVLTKWEESKMHTAQIQQQYAEYVQCTMQQNKSPYLEIVNQCARLYADSAFDIESYKNTLYHIYKNFLSYQENK